MQEDSFDYHRNKKAGKTYVSPSIVSTEQPGELGVQAEPERRFRIASKVIDGVESHGFVQELGKQLIRVTGGGRQEIVAKFYEDDRGIFTLQIQRFNVRDGKPLKVHFSFHGDEVVQLIEFILNMKRVHLPDNRGLNVTD